MKKRSVQSEEINRRKSKITDLVFLDRLHFSAVERCAFYFKARHDRIFLNTYLESSLDVDSNLLFLIFLKHGLADEKWRDIFPETFA